MVIQTRSAISWVAKGFVALLTASLFFMLSLPAKKYTPPTMGPTRELEIVIPQPTEVDSLPYTPPSLRVESLPALSPVNPTVISHGPREKKLVALTFDACSTLKPSRYDERITKTLIETNTPATLFLGGKWIEEDSAQTKYLASFPQFELANHTFLHPHLLKVSDERVRQELRWTQEAMFSVTGRQATLFRPPYGEYDDRIVRIAAEMGLTTVQYDLASGDPDPHISKEELIKYVSSMAKNGSIIVMHVNRRGWHTAEALPEIISRLRARGFVFVTVSQLIALSLPSTEEKEKARD
jgi:peptidoglycan/xylan/chitin deacetylase (PgdA/CDA1 family)